MKIEELLNVFTSFGDGHTRIYRKADIFNCDVDSIPLFISGKSIDELRKNQGKMLESRAIADMRDFYLKVYEGFEKIYTSPSAWAISEISPDGEYRFAWWEVGRNFHVKRAMYFKDEETCVRALMIEMPHYKMQQLIGAEKFDALKSEKNREVAALVAKDQSMIGPSDISEVHEFRFRAKGIPFYIVEEYYHETLSLSCPDCDPYVSNAPIGHAFDKFPASFLLSEPNTPKEKTLLHHAYERISELLPYVRFWQEAYGARCYWNGPEAGEWEIPDRFASERYLM